MEDVIVYEKTDAEIALEINVIKRKTAQDVLTSAIEIGRLLCEAKAQIPHGAWGDWLRDNVSYSVSNANNMMRLYRERRRMDQIDLFGENDPDIFEGMNLSQAIALLELPSEERREFIEENNARDMSVRELQTAIREKKEADLRAEEAIRRAELAEERAKEAEAEATASEAKSEEADMLLEKLLSERNEALSELERMKDSPVPEEKIKELSSEIEKRFKENAEKKIKAAEKKAEKDIAAARGESAEAAKKAAEAFEKEKADIIAAEREKAKNEYADTIKALEDKLKAQAIAASPHLLAFRLHMESLKESYRKLSETVCAAESEDPETGSKLRAMLGQITSMLGGDN